VTELSDEITAYPRVADDADRLPAREREWLQKLITVRYERLRLALPPGEDDADDGDRHHESPFDEINVGAEREAEEEV
jgi:hypothetical protein